MGNEGKGKIGKGKVSRIGKVYESRKDNVEFYFQFMNDKKLKGNDREGEGNWQEKGREMWRSITRNGKREREVK